MVLRPQRDLQDTEVSVHLYTRPAGHGARCRGRCSAPSHTDCMVWLEKTSEQPVSVWCGWFRDKNQPRGFCQHQVGC